MLMRRTLPSSTRPARSKHRWWSRLRPAVAGLAAVALMAGGSVSLLSSTASATTTSTTLTMTSGTFGAHGNTPTALPTPATFSGKVSTTTGNITAGTLTIPSWKESNTGSTETIHIFDVHSGTATGSVSYNGNVTIDDTVTVQVHITSPVNETCNATPVHLVLQSTSPYNTTTKDVDLSDTTFSIPNFSTSTCSLAASSLDTRFSGSTGNVLTLDLHGTLTEPPAPATSTTTSLSASPASPQRQGTTVTLTGTVKKTTGATATAATGTMDFYSGTTEVGAASVSSGVATFSTKSLPSGTDSLKAVYSGNSAYNGSTSSSQNYTIEPNPTVTSTLPITVTRGTATASTFNVKVTNPSGGVSWTHLKLALRLTNIDFQKSTNVTLTYENATSTWCSLSLSGSGTIRGTFKGLAGACGSTSNFSLAAGHSLTVPFRIKFASGANVGTQTASFALETLNATGAVVAPFTATLTTGVYVNAPAVYSHVQVDPATKYSVTIAANPPSTAIPKGYTVPPNATITPPANTGTTAYPTPTGTVKYQVTGVTVTPVTPPGWTTPRPIILGATYISTAGLSTGTHTLKVNYSGDGVYNAASATKTFTVGTAITGTAFTCSSDTDHTIAASVVASATLPATTYTGSASATSLKITLHVDPYVGPDTVTAVATVLIGFTPGGGTTAGSVTPTESGGTTTLAWTGLSATITGITGTVGTEIPVGITTIDFSQDGKSYSCTKSTTAAHLATVKVAAPPTPVTWSLSGCTSGSTTAPAWANTEKIVAKGAGGGSGGAAASATGWGGRGGAGGSVTTTFTIAGSTKVSGKTGCAGKGAPQGGGVVGNGGASVSGWSASGAGGQGRYTAIGIAKGDDGTGGSGGGSTGVCNGASTCTSATTAHVVTVAGGGGGGGESMCSGTDAGSGGQAGNAGTTATSSSKGKGLSGTGGATGGTGGVAGGAGGANNKSSGSGSAAGSTGGEGKEPVAGDGGGSGGGGAGYIGGAGGAPTADDCGAGGGGGGGASWVATAGGSTTFGTGSSGGSRSGTTGTAGSVTVTFSYTKTR
jgi:Big-like domain-containing protein